jgi:PPOX class probable F420-dependent enzyme
MLPPDLQHTLHRARTLYLTTYSRSGKAGTVPIWFFLHHGRMYFCTQRDSLKVRRIRRNNRVTIRIGRRHGPSLACTAHCIEDHAELQRLLLHTYRRRYWWLWLFIGPRLRRALARGESVIVQLHPLPAGTTVPDA